MPQGLEVFNADGSLRLGLSDRICRLLGVFDSPKLGVHPNSAGGIAVRTWTLTDARLAAGTPFFYGQNPLLGMTQAEWKATTFTFSSGGSSKKTMFVYQPMILSLSGNTLSYGYDAIAADSLNKSKTYWAGATPYDTEIYAYSKIIYGIY